MPPESSFTKEDEIRPQELFRELLNLVENDAYALAQTGDFEETGCPACQSPKYNFLYEKHSYKIVECEECRSLFVNPRPTAESLTGFYTHSASAKFFVDRFYPAVEQSRREKLIPPRLETIAKLVDAQKLHSGVILDVGAGQGFFLEALRERWPRFECRTIEPSVRFARICQTKSIRVLEKRLEQIHDEWQGEIDLLTCFEVFEHAHSPHQFASVLYKLLKPGGSVLLTSLTGDGFDIRVLGQRANIVAPPQHLNYLSVQGYERLFKDVGFDRVEVTTPGKLDINIVENKQAEIPSVVRNGFIKILLKQDSVVKQRFQEFLASNKLSSHVWVIARKAKKSIPGDD